MSDPTVDEIIALVKEKAKGRTRYDGQLPYWNEILVAEIERLREIETTKRFAPENADFWLLRESCDGTGRSVQFDAFQVFLDGSQLKINLTGRQLDMLLEWEWRTG